jgi:hypothetical protein
LGRYKWKAFSGALGLAMRCDRSLLSCVVFRDRAQNEPCEQCLQITFNGAGSQGLGGGSPPHPGPVPVVDLVGSLLLVGRGSRYGLFPFEHLRCLQLWCRSSDVTGNRPFSILNRPTAELDCRPLYESECL